MLRITLFYAILKNRLTDFFTCNTMILSQNKSFHLPQWLKCCCKYLTYKEWKHPSNDIFEPYTKGKYLTYKEWKPLVTRVPAENFSACKYLTYKEWKLQRIGTVADCLDYIALSM